jgi:hypothetical protein
VSLKLGHISYTKVVLFLIFRNFNFVILLRCLLQNPGASPELGTLILQKAHLEYIVRWIN